MTEKFSHPFLDLNGEVLAWREQCPVYQLSARVIKGIRSD